MKPYESLGYRSRHHKGVYRVLPLMLLAVLFALCTSTMRAQQELHVAAASDLQPVLPTLAAEYEKQTGVKVIASFGSSATLAQQISNGDPQDVFLSADTSHPAQLIAAGLATGLHGATKPTPYASGLLVVWARRDSPAQPISIASLTSPKVTKIAVANPSHAPYGLAAQQALASLHLTEAVQPKLAIAENIGQTAQFAESGNAQLGLISLTIASSPHYRELGSFVPLPKDSYQPIQQSGVILKSSTHKAAAEAFLTWLTSPAVQSKLPSFGLDPAPKH